MQVSISLPDEIADQLGSQWSDIPRRVLEALATDALREGLLTERQVQILLGLESRFELDEFLARSRVYRDYDSEDLEQDRAALDDILGP